MMGYEDFLIEDYKLKVNYLTSHFSRMWTRFNFFLTVQTGIFGFWGYLLFDANNQNAELSIIPTVLGLFISLLWFFVGAQDRALVKGYRDDIKFIAEKIAQIDDRLWWYKDSYVGSAYSEKQQKASYHGLFSWYYKPTSITKLAAIIPFFLSLFWIVLGAITFPYWRVLF
ncbi:RipA family octameric membrane protein [Fodinibius salsisoli]|uniref:SMODS and SLOG-associating 2TM effector domain-containing protein n=1 Tax=Fodinibius salsisoli TaxID=2820877 RepID=A0ABT3PQJ3_9BACT|nr:hypothetical protein [Fodinibius salsisoli]MCW9708139.1 hypothetical protein [Fodinibius salsisoli]